MLKDLLKSREKMGFAIPILETEALVAGARDTMERRRDCFHPSEISGDFCPRAWILGQRDPSLHRNRQVGPQLQWVFDTGTWIHDLVQVRLGQSGKLFGMWQCKRWCQKERCMHYGFKPDSHACPLGYNDRATWEYREVPVVDDELGIRGHTDGILLLDAGKYVFEFKTMNSRRFATLAEPLDEHREQASWYLDVLSRNSHMLEQLLLTEQEYGFDVSEALRVVRKPFKGVIIAYMNKDTQEFREFVIEASAPFEMPSAIKVRGMSFPEKLDILQEKKELLRQTLVWHEEGVLPDRLDVCTSKGCVRARRCFAKEACFEKEETR